MTVAHEILTVAKKTLPLEVLNTHRDRLMFLVRCVNDLTDNQWRKLSDRAQKWSNEAVTAVNENRTIPEPPSEDTNVPGPDQKAVLDEGS